VAGRHGPKIFSSADKIFSVSKYEPIGTMVYGSAAFMQVPWETIIKVYREQLADQSFARVDGYVQDFMQFLARSDNLLFDDTQKHDFAFRQAASFFDHIADGMIRAVEDAADVADRSLTVPESRRVALKVINSHHKSWSRRTDRAGLPSDMYNQVIDTYAADFEAAKDAVFSDFALPRGASRQLTELAAFINTKEKRQGHSGIVFAGFGREEVFPQLVWYELDGVLLDTLVGGELSRMAISAAESALVQGFAQSDVIALFMEGVTTEYEEFIEGYIEKVIAQYGSAILTALPDGVRSPPVEAALSDIAQRLMRDLRRDFRDRRQTDYISPVLDVVASLPKDELGSMAESLVNLTSLKRRISMEDETVGGPVDVAVITKGDGLIWTQRKHYFDPALNQHFFANYYRRTRAT
jgi:hypothetical protein